MHRTMRSCVCVDVDERGWGVDVDWLEEKSVDPALDQSEVRISRTGGQSEFFVFFVVGGCLVGARVYEKNVILVGRRTACTGKMSSEEAAAETKPEAETKLSRSA